MTSATTIAPRLANRLAPRFPCSLIPTPPMPDLTPKPALPPRRTPRAACSRAPPPGSDTPGARRNCLIFTSAGTPGHCQFVPKCSPCRVKQDDPIVCHFVHRSSGRVPGQPRHSTGRAHARHVPSCAARSTPTVRLAPPCRVSARHARETAQRRSPRHAVSDSDWRLICASLRWPASHSCSRHSGSLVRTTPRPCRWEPWRRRRTTK